MERLRFFFVNYLFLVSCTVLFGSMALAKIPEPSAVYYGNVTIGTINVTAENTVVQVSLLIGDEIVSTYQMGSNTELGDQYILVVPMDAVGEREPNSGRQGDVATIMVMDSEAETFSISGKGRFVEKNLSVTANDSDIDGIPDLWESQNGFDPFDASDASDDPDEDGLDNAAEYAAGTDPNNADSDGDGMNDGYEIAYGFKPTDDSDAALDPDGDGYTNLEEAQNGTDPALPNQIDPFRVEIARMIPGHDGNVSALLINGDKLVSASQHEAGIRIWNVADGLLDSSADSGASNGINTLAVDGTLLFAGTGDSNVLLYETAGGDPVLDSNYPDAQGSILALSVHNHKLIAGSADGSAYVWDTPTRSFEKSWEVYSSEQDPDGLKFITGVGATDNKIYTLESFPYKTLKIWDWNNEDDMLSLSSSKDCCDLTNLHMEGATLFISGLYTVDKIAAIDLEAFSREQEYEGNIGEGAVLSSANNRFFSSGDNGDMNVWSKSNSNFLMAFKAHGQPIKSLIAVDNLLITGDTSGLIKIWNLYNDVAGDKDFDNMADSWEVAYFASNSADRNQDADADGLTNLEEYINQTDPTLSDSDVDQMPDKWEVDNNLNPNLAADAALDPDGDGLSNLQEFQGGTDPQI